MSAIVIDGKKRAREVRQKLAEESAKLAETLGRAVTLGVILVGDEPASASYVRSKEREATKTKIRVIKEQLPADVSLDTVLDLVSNLNARDDIDGILVQLPLPDGIPADCVLTSIDPRKDVDGLHPFNQGLLFGGAFEEAFVPCTPAGCLDLIDSALASLGRSTDLSGLTAVVVGRSRLVGRPMAALLLNRGCSVTVCHSQTPDISEFTKVADIVVVACGVPALLSGKDLKSGAVVIDVGINRIEGNLVGDVDFVSAQAVVGALTPVPGGVGPMTVVMLLANAIKAARERFSRTTPN